MRSGSDVMINDTCSADWLARRLSIASRDQSGIASIAASQTTERDSPVDDVNAKVVILDCRSPDEYAVCHVIGSLGIVVPAIVLRRMRSVGTFPVSAASAIGVVTEATGSNRCTSGLLEFAEHCRATEVVVLLYSSGLDDIRPDDDLHGLEQTDLSPAVVDLLSQRLVVHGCRVCKLQGGFAAFKKSFGHLCVDVSEKVHANSTSSLNLSSLCLSPQTMTSSHRPAALVKNGSFPVDEVAPLNRSVEEVFETPCGRRTVCRRFADHPFPVQVLPHLYLGDAASSRDLECLRRHDIRYVINVTPHLPNAFAECPDFRYLRIPINDHWSENITPFFKNAVSFIEEARIAKSSVLIHCLAGISRSVTITVAYLMSSANLSLNDAFDHLRRCRHNISPNFSFMRQLTEFEETLSYSTELDCHRKPPAVSSSLAVE